MMRTFVLMVALVACSGGGKRGDSTTNTSSNADDARTGSSATGSGAAAELTGVGIALNVTPREATVTIDDIVMGGANQLDPVVALAPGLHTLVVEHPGHKAYRAEFSVTDKVEKFTVVLEPTK